MADDVFSLAAQQAYYFFLALFPALLTVQNVTDEIIKTLGRFAPPEVLTILNEQFQKIATSENGGLFTFAFLVTIWSSSGAMSSIITT